MSLSSLKSTFFIAILLLLFSCGKSSEQEIKDSILEATILLSTSQCQSAIDLLESIGRQNTNAYYLKALSTAYACRAGYSSVVFFGSDIEKTAVPGPLGGMATYSTSTGSTVPLTSDLKFRDLQTAIDILLYAGGTANTTNPTSALRSTLFSTNHAADINTQAAFMMMVQLGKVIRVYANTDDLGEKGAGTGGSNSCFTDYSTIPAAVEVILMASGGNCSSKASPHIQLDSSVVVDVAERRKRLCEGIILVNGILDLLPSIITSVGGTQLGDIGPVLDDITAGRAILEASYPDIGVIMNVLSQTNCETNPLITNQIVESYYAAVIEALVE